MAEKIFLTALSPTMETGTIIKWHKKEGDYVHSGDVLCEVETDKATMDYESTFDDFLLKIITNEGSEVKVGETIGIAGNQNEDIKELLKTEKEPTKTVLHEKIPETKSSDKEAEKNIIPTRTKASPLAREIAVQNNIDLSLIKGSGPEGRIVKSDVENYARKSKEQIEKPLIENEIKKTVNQKKLLIAKRLSESKFSAPHFYLTISINMKNIINARKELIDKLNSKVSFNAFFIKFAAETIKIFPDFNSTWENDSIIEHGSIDIGLATSQEDGLITPVVKNCESKGIISINRELQDLIPRARESKLSPDEYSNATFTISNLGSYGIRQFTAIINPPGSAILAIGEIFNEQYSTGKDSFNIREVCLMTLSCDHRIIYGAVAAEFARHFKNLIENPINIIF